MRRKVVAHEERQQRVFLDVVHAAEARRVGDVTTRHEHLDVDGAEALRGVVDRVVPCDVVDVLVLEQRDVGQERVPTKVPLRVQVAVGVLAYRQLDVSLQLEDADGHVASPLEEHGQRLVRVRRKVHAPLARVGAHLAPLALRVPRADVARCAVQQHAALEGDVRQVSSAAAPRDSVRFAAKAVTSILTASATAAMTAAMTATTACQSII